MKKKLFKKIVVLSMAMALTLTLALTLSLPALAELDVWGSNTGGLNREELGNNLGLGERDPREIVAQVINVILGFLGIIAVVIILLGGFKWMTAGGGEDKVAEAKKMIVAGVIGLVIILASYAIATFVINQLLSATGGT